MDISQLRVALAKSIHERDQLRSAAILRSQSAPEVLAPCYFLKKLPIEIRRKIYALLLVNEAFASPQSIDPQSIHKSKTRSSDEKYGISTSILFACRQIYSEASVILYESNTFYFNCIASGYCGLPRITHFALPFNMEFFETSRGKERLKVMKRIKRWKVAISTYQSHNRSDHLLDQREALYFFCKEIHNCPVVSIHIIIAPIGIQYHESRTLSKYKNAADDHHPLELLVWPLRMLPKWESLKITEAKNPELPYWEIPMWDAHNGRRSDGPSEFTPPDTWPKLGLEKLSAGLKTSMKSESPEDIVLDMYLNLLRYCKAFERCETYKEEMHAKKWGEAAKIQKCRSGACCCSGGRAWCRVRPARGYIKRRIDFKSPFHEHPGHPVENALHIANAASETNDLATFRQCRKTILEYLEPQYQRIMAASVRLIDLIKEEKTEGGCFNIRPRFWREERDCSLAYLLLRRYAEAFRRDMPEEIECVILLQQHKFDSHYKTLPREILLKQMSARIEQDLHDSHEEIVDLIRRAMDDMDAQYLEIRQARKELFDFDLTLDYGCEIDPEKWRFDGNIDWSVNEPIIGAKNEEQSRAGEEQGEWEMDIW